MNELIQFGMGVIVLMVMWHYLIREAVLDYARDKLFDLRESVRQHYIDTGVGLEDATYRELRLLINRQIRFLEDTSFTQMIFIRAAVKANPILKECSEGIKQKFATDNKPLAEYITEVRGQAFHHSLTYMIYSSITLTGVTYMCFLPMVGYLFFKKIIAATKARTLHSAHVLFRSYMQVPCRNASYREAIEMPSRCVISRDLLENMSTISEH